MIQIKFSKQSPTINLLMCFGSQGLKVALHYSARFQPPAECPLYCSTHVENLNQCNSTCLNGTIKMRVLYKLKENTFNDTYINILKYIIHYSGIFTQYYSYSYSYDVNIVKELFRIPKCFY